MRAILLILGLLILGLLIPGLLIPSLVTPVSGAASAGVNSIDPARIAAIDQAAKGFLARAAQARSSGGAIPRQSDPEIRRLLDTVFDTGRLGGGAGSVDDIEALGDWMLQIADIGRVYLQAGADGNDLAQFAPEIGRFIDAYATVIKAIGDTVRTVLDAHPEIKLSRSGERKLAASTDKVGRSFGTTVGLLAVPGFAPQWIRERLPALVAAGPSVGRLLRPGARRSVHAEIRRTAAAMSDAEARDALAKLAETVAAPPTAALPSPATAEAPPSAPVVSSLPSSAPAPETAAPITGDIALERIGHDYWVPVLIDGTVTVKCVLDTGASTIALPANLVAEMTHAGTLGPSDALSRQTYVTADGKRHHAERVILREVSVGGHTVKNVVAAVVPAGAPPLLGQGFLAKFKSWTLDNHRRVLVITE